MTTIPRDFIELLLSRTEIVDLIDGRVTLRKKSGNNYFACCPFHNEKSPSFSVSQNKQFYYCFGCGAHGNAIDFLMQFDRMSFPEAVESLANTAGMEVPRSATTRSPEKTANQQSLYELLDQVSKYYQTQLKQEQRAIDYFKNRGVSGVVAKDFGLGFAPAGWDHVLQELGQTPQLKQQLFDTGMLIKKDDGGYYDRFRDRVMFPIHDRRGRVIGFGGRILDKGEPKYLNSPETPIFQKGHELYGLYQALQANRQLTRAIIVEGYMDVIALFQYGITYAVATLGTATSAHHLQRLFRYTSELVFCFDGDTAGRTAAWRALQVTLPLMRDGLQVRFMFLPEGEDPDSLVRKEGKEAFEQRMMKASPLADFFFHSIAQQADTSTTDGRARFVKLATDMLKQIPEGIFQQMMWDELAKRARIDVAQLSPKSTSGVLPKQTERPSPLKARPPSPLRFAITLLVQYPHLVEHIDELPDLSLQGYDLFKELIAQAKLNPKITTGALLENWRDKPEAKLLSKLAQWEHLIPEQGIPNEFIGTLKKLNGLARESTIETLLSKAAQIGLSQEEKLQLSELINTKQ